MNTKNKIPVTVLTGFLGSGKTTLLNKILSEEHGKRIAVIENEYGEVGIDQALVIDAEEEIFEMSNGCICCTVRGDLIRILSNLMKRRDKFDYVLVETTGLADPGPVAQTFFMDDEISEQFSLDGIVTLVDAGHIQQQLGRSDESTEQIAFADVIILNKIDLIDDKSLDYLENRLREMNKMAKIVRCQMADTPVDTVLNLSAFNLEEVLERRPTFLEPEYPFEWTGVFSLEPGKYELNLDEGPDPEMSIVISDNQAKDDSSLRESAEWSVRRYAEPKKDISPGEEIPFATHANLLLTDSGRKSFFLNIEQAANFGLFTQHTAEEFDLQLIDSKQNKLEPVTERTWVAQHEHDDEVGSIAIETDGDINPEKFNSWIGKLLQERGVDIFRSKGFISIAGESKRYVFQGVHMLIDFQPDRPWGDTPRRNQLIFIGRNLNEQEIRSGFEECMI